MQNEKQPRSLDSLEKSSPFWSLIGFFVVIGTLLGGVALGEVQARYPTLNVTIVFAIAGATVGFILFIYTRFVRHAINSQSIKINERLDRIETIVSRSNVGIDQDNDSMMSQLEFVRFEQSFDGNEVWVISSTLENDDPGTGVYHKVVVDNLARGLRYRYFYPRTALTLGRATRMQNALQAKANQVTWHDLPPDVFLLHVGKNMGVYRNTTTGASDLTYVEIKFDKTVRWAKVDEALTIDLVGWITQYMIENTKG